jgi:hypothetical protein
VPAAGEQREAAFAQGAQGPKQGVVGAVVRSELATVGGLFDRGVDAFAGAVVAGVSEGGQLQLGGGPVQGTVDVVLAGAGQVVQVSGQGLRGPDRQPVRARDRLDVGAEVAVLAGVPGVDELAFDAGGGLGEPVGGEQLAVEDDVRPAVVGDPGQRLVQVGSLGGEDLDALGQVAVGGGAGDADPVPSSVLSPPLRNQASTSSAWYQQVSALVARRVPRARRSAASSRDR